MLINLSSFCWKSKTKFWSRKTSGREGLSEHRSYKTETILLNHKLGECGGGADQTIRPVCTWWRCTFWSLPQATQPYLLHLLSGWQRRGSTGRWQEVTEAPLKRFTRCMSFHLSSKNARETESTGSAPAVGDQFSATIRDVLASELCLSFCGALFTLPSPE